MNKKTKIVIKSQEFKILKVRYFKKKLTFWHKKSQLKPLDFSWDSKHSLQSFI